MLKSKQKHKSIRVHIDKNILGVCMPCRRNYYAKFFRYTERPLEYWFHGFSSVQLNNIPKKMYVYFNFSS